MEQKHPLAGLSFPLSLEEFIARYKEICGKELEAAHRELLGAWLPVINAAYRSGAEGKGIVEAFPEQAHTDAAAAFIKTMRMWEHFAWLCGGVKEGGERGAP